MIVCLSVRLKELRTNKNFTQAQVAQCVGVTRAVIEHYSYNDIHAGETDDDLSESSIAHDEKQINPLIKQAQSINSGLRIFGTPLWMKEFPKWDTVPEKDDNGNNIHNSLQTKY